MACFKVKSIELQQRIKIFPIQEILANVANTASKMISNSQKLHLLILYVV